MKVMKGKTLPIILIIILAVVGVAVYFMGQPTPYSPPVVTQPKVTAPAAEQTQQTTPAPTQPTTQTLSITVGTSAASYKADQNIKISGTSLPETSITLEVQNQFGTTTRTRLLTADANGNYEDNFKYSTKTTKGTYTVIVTATKSGMTATNTTTFELTL